MPRLTIDVVARREREILEQAVRTVAEQAVKANELSTKRRLPGGDHPVTVHAKMLRLELLKVKAEALVDQGIAVGFGTLGLCIVVPRCRKHPLPEG